MLRLDKGVYKIIEIAPMNNGAHNNQNGNFSSVPNGWAIIPDDMKIPDTFPFVDIEVIDGIVTSMNAIDMSNIKRTVKKPIKIDCIEAQITYTAMITDTILNDNGIEENIAKWYQQGLWTADMVQYAVKKGKITEKEASEILK